MFGLLGVFLLVFTRCFAQHINDMVIMMVIVTISTCRSRFLEMAVPRSTGTGTDRTIVANMP